MFSLEYQKLEFEDLSLKDIGIPLLLLNKGEKEYAILCGINFKDKTIDIHFGRNDAPLLSNCDNFYRVFINQ